MLNKPRPTGNRRVRRLAIPLAVAAMASASLIATAGLASAAQSDPPPSCPLASSADAECTQLQPVPPDTTPATVSPDPGTGINPSVPQIIPFKSTTPGASDQLFIESNLEVTWATVSGYNQDGDFKTSYWPMLACGSTTVCGFTANWWWQVSDPNDLQDEPTVSLGYGPTDPSLTGNVITMQGDFLSLYNGPTYLCIINDASQSSC